MLIKKYGHLSIFQILFVLFIAFLCICGCLEKATGPLQESSSELSDQLPDSVLQMDFDVELSRDLFRLQGDLLLPGATNLGYILLNASLLKEESPIFSTKYLLMQVEPNREYGFEICRSCRLESGEYDCILNAESPQGIIAKEVRKVGLEGSKDRPDGWSQAEETAFWQMIEEYDREDDNAGDEREEDESGAVEGEEDKSDEVMEGEARREAGAIEEGAYREDDPMVDGVGKESQVESSNSESSSIALFSGYRAGGDGDGMSSNEERLVASKSSKKYHRPDCRFAQKIKPENLISFSGVEDAKREGYLPCKFCNP